MTRAHDRRSYKTLAQKISGLRVRGVSILRVLRYMDTVGTLPGWVRRSLKKPTSADSSSSNKQSLKAVYNVDVPEPRWAQTK